MFPTLQIGSASLQTSGLVILASIWIGLVFSEKLAVRKGISADYIYNLVAISLIAGLFGARLGYFFENINAFSKNISSLFSLQAGLSDTFVGIATAIISGAIYLQRKKLPLWETLDAITPFLSVLVVGIGFSHFASGKAYGMPASLPWSIELWGAKRHPSQIYEIIAGLIVVGFIWQQYGRLTVPGTLFLKFIMLTSLWVLFLEGFRGDSQIFAGGIRTVQVIALIAFCIAAYFLERLLGHKGIATDG